ncbi:unnamed protein product, partial [Vitis vinifera]
MYITIIITFQHAEFLAKLSSIKILTLSSTSVKFSTQITSWPKNKTNR